MAANALPLQGHLGGGEGHQLSSVLADDMHAAADLALHDAAQGMASFFGVPLSDLFLFKKLTYFYVK